MFGNKIMVNEIKLLNVHKKCYLKKKKAKAFNMCQVFKKLCVKTIYEGKKWFYVKLIFLKAFTFERRHRGFWLKSRFE